MQCKSEQQTYYLINIWEETTSVATAEQFMVRDRAIHSESSGNLGVKVETLVKRNKVFKKKYWS